MAVYIIGTSYVIDQHKPVEDNSWVEVMKTEMYNKEDIVYNEGIQFKQHYKTNLEISTLTVHY